MAGWDFATSVNACYAAPDLRNHTFSLHRPFRHGRHSIDPETTNHYSIIDASSAFFTVAPCTTSILFPYPLSPTNADRRTILLLQIKIRPNSLEPRKRLPVQVAYSSTPDAKGVSETGAEPLFPLVR
ncbi:hypothetical protein M413DRAFT_449374 [Hebeloma cylindrosporum]|uniref:Uncharacterized protein n=1 Tax=Hebeloma cylindrosporum TaxID=76867 RepID=A0A0C2XDN4_HEBCY|nr:hypothetical protein M413DRAFT_449374 [Hebeloma cylindrosporum h7]